MDDRKQESQKTVVAFIAGLLIGGLLVWVFTGTPETEAPVMDTDTDTERVTETDDTDDIFTNGTVDDEAATTTDDEVVAPPAPTGDGSVSMDDQPAGATVVLDAVVYPGAEGWIAVHESTGGTLGNALGAARFNTAAGLTPTSVALLRATTPGQTYSVVFYAENGDRIFDLRTDAQVEVAGTFVAQ